VHNGIITNYRTLRSLLQKNGMVFETDTDTEVIPKLAEYLYLELGRPQSFKDLIAAVLAQLEGAYALVFQSSYYPGEMIACKNGSPLILGACSFAEESKGGAPQVAAPQRGGSLSAPGEPGQPCELFLSSDASAIVEHTKNVVVLENNELVHIVDGGYGVYKLTEGSAGQELRSIANPAFMQLELEVEEIMKGEYDHFMIKEIFEQPESITQTMRGRILVADTEGGRPSRPSSPPAVLPSPSEDQPCPGGSEVALLSMEEALKSGRDLSRQNFKVVLGGLASHMHDMQHGRRLILAACGSSYHSGLAARQVIEELTHIPVVLEIASDMLDRRPPLFRDDTCIFISQSGETADTLQALRYAKQCGSLCVGVTNTVGSSISRETHCGVHINAGCEIGVASTKAYTSQVLVLIMIALAMSEDSKRLSDRRQEIMRSMAQLPMALERVLERHGSKGSFIEELAKDQVSKRSLLVFGRSYNYATAMEAALKVKEVSLTHSEGVNAGEMKHGVLALVDEDMPIIVMATKDGAHAKMESTIQQLQAREGRLVAIVGENSGSESGHGNEGSRGGGAELKRIEVPEVADCLQPIVNIVPMQLLSYHLALLRGLNVDQPRNLAKAVTVE
jgi:glucosamine--fructose-6-phosphate aminotransferase (isomerizing)